MRTLISGLAGAFAWLLVLNSQAAIFTNGSFETGPNPGDFATKSPGDTSIVGWTVNGPGGIDYIGSLWVASNGARSLDLNALSPGGIFQTFDTVAGEQYQVLFDMAGNPDAGPVVKTMNVNVGAFTQAYSFDTTGKSRSSMGWLPNSFNFVATSASSTLTFTSTTIGFSGNAGFPTAFGPALDNVRVSAVNPIPEPASLAIWGAISAVGLVAGRIRRRRGE